MKSILYSVGLFCLVTASGFSAADSQTSSSLITASLVTSATTQFENGVLGDLQKVVAGHQGVMGIYCKHLGNGETFQINADEPFPTASTIKLAVMVTAFDLLAKGTGPYNSYYDKIPYDAAKSFGGSGFIQNYKDKTQLELKELMHLMITVSDNIATNMLCEWIGLDVVNGWLSRNGFDKTRIFSTVGGSSVSDPDGRKIWGLGRTTPREIGLLLEMIVSGEAGTTSTTDEMLRLLGHQYFDGGIPGAIPPMTYVGSKGGSVSDSRSDTAIIASPSGVYILTVYTKDNKDKSWNSSNEAERAIGKTSELLWKHFNPESRWNRPEGCEKF